MFLCANKIFNEDLSRSKVYYNISDIPKITQLLSLYISCAECLYNTRNEHIKAIEETKIHTECLADDGKYEFLAVDAPVDVNEYLSSKLNGKKI